MIKICPIGPALRNTPFHDRAAQNLLQRKGVRFCDEADADILVSSTVQGLLKSLFTYRHRKRYLIWTLDPRFNTCFDSLQRYPFLPPIHIFNLYSGPFESNSFFFPSKQLLQPLKYFHSFKHRAHKRKIVSFMTYQAGRRWRLPYQGRDLDLCNLRTEIAIAAHRQDRIDIYGRNWPKRIAVKGNSRDNQDWRSFKTKILANYHFNLCFETTNWPYYCSEKIWQAIQGGCLPIYYGQDNRIYDDFPQESFIDYAELGSPEALFWALDEMLPQEFLERYNRCVAAYNLALEQHHTSNPTGQLLKKTLAKLQAIAAD